MDEIIKRIDSAVAYIKSKCPLIPAVGVVLGSGLGSFCDLLDDGTELSFSEIPGFPRTTVEGHDGAFVLGHYKGTPVAVCRGRVHYYEGSPQNEITIPVRVMRALGAKSLLLTNAAGGVNLSFTPGTLMIISDHINMTGDNPLRGQNADEFGPRFPDMTDVYTRGLRSELFEKAKADGLNVREGVYMMYPGPSYETPAEIRAFRTLGADAVGMSTVPEAIVARHAGMRVIGVSCITNMAAGVLDGELSHGEVVETAERVKGEFLKLAGIAVELFSS